MQQLSPAIVSLSLGQLDHDACQIPLQWNLDPATHQGSPAPGLFDVGHPVDRVRFEAPRVNLTSKICVGRSRPRNKLQ